VKPDFEVSLENYFAKEHLLVLSTSAHNGAAVLSPLVSEIATRCGAVCQPMESIRVGRVISSSSSGAEVAVYIERGRWVGAAVTCRWIPELARCRIWVRPLAPFVAKLQWWLLGAGLVLGLLIGRSLSHVAGDATLLFLLSMLLGVGLFFPLLAAASRMASAADRARSVALTDQVRASLKTLPLT
jgi:hypothetical protein